MGYDDEYEARQNFREIHRTCRLGDIEGLDINGISVYVDNVKIHYYKTFYAEGFEAEYDDPRIDAGGDIQISIMPCFLNSFPSHENNGVTGQGQTWAQLIEQILIGLSENHVNWEDD